MSVATRASKETRLVRSDLAALDLTLEEIDGRLITEMDRDLYGVGQGLVGYRIPYRDIDGGLVDHSRLRIVDVHAPAGEGGRMISSSKEERWLYFPMDFRGVLEATRAEVAHACEERGAGVTTPIVVVVDDERLACWVQKKVGVPCIALQGPGGWRRGEVPAWGLPEFVEAVLERGACVVLWMGDGSDANVQREVAAFAMELKFRGLGLASVRQYLGNALSRAVLASLLLPLTAFPRHPNIRGYVAGKMALVDAGGKINRRGMQEVALAMLADLEANGRRIQSVETNEFFYYDNTTRELLRASVVVGKEMMTSSEFAAHIYNRYGISTVDNAIMRWFATQMVAEKPIRRTKSLRQLNTTTRDTNDFAMAVTSGAFVHISQGTGDGGGVRVLDNGSRGLLFEKSSVREGFHLERFRDALDLQSKSVRKGQRMLPIPCWWLDVLRTVRLPHDEELLTLVALLYYVSPWLKGWRGIQLPVEVVVGEAGTGKSSLFSLRLLIMTGIAKLRNLPDSLKDFHAVVASNTGLLVFDNVHLMQRGLRQQLSDEMCRLTTEADPRVEMRQLFTTANVAEYGVGSVFGMTSVTNVFVNIDFIQRALILRTGFGASELGAAHTYENWVERQLQARGGREAWLAHHMLALERFFFEVTQGWEDRYAAKTRLLHLEQALVMMGRVFGLDVAGWLPHKLAELSAENTLLLDETLAGLKAYTEELRGKGRSEFTAEDVVDWASVHEDYCGNQTLCSTRRLGKYIGANSDVVRRSVGVRVKPVSVSPRIYEIFREERTKMLRRRETE